TSPSRHEAAEAASRNGSPCCRCWPDCEYLCLITRRSGPVLDPHELYELTADLPDLGRPVLIQALTGFVDAGAATRLAGERSLSTLDSRPVAPFDIDQLLDYRSRRPVMIFVEDHWEEYDEPRLVLHLLHDDAGSPFLLLSGPEP